MIPSLTAVADHLNPAFAGFNLKNIEKTWITTAIKQIFTKICMFSRLKAMKSQ